MRPMNISEFKYPEYPPLRAAHRAILHFEDDRAGLKDLNGMPLASRDVEAEAVVTGRRSQTAKCG